MLCMGNILVDNSIMPFLFNLLVLGNNSESNIKQEAIIVNGIRRKLLAEYQSIELSIQQQDDIFGLMRSVEDRFMTLYFDQCN